MRFAALGALMLRLVAHQAGTDPATRAGWIDVWAAVLDSTARPGAGTLTVAGRAVPLPAEAWSLLAVDDEMPADARTVWTQKVRVGGLAAGQRHVFEAAVGAQRARCTGATLPLTLPGPYDPPFVVLLGSCFASYRAEEGLPGRAIAELPPDHAPHVKLLIGDQVYLDNPAWEVLPRGRGPLAARLLRKYLDTWGQGDSDTGFAAILERGSTWFLADDHEFWNNHPNWSPLLATRGRRARDEWRAIATELFAGFTGRPPAALPQPQRFSVGPIEFYLADTRFGRQPGDDEFMDPGAFADLLAWLGDPARRWPSVLVMSAPLFTEASGWLGASLADRTLANYAQYGPLADAVLECRRSLLVLAGDVHFGRVAVVRRPADMQLIEVVASPLALVSDLVGRKFTEAPKKFPVQAGRHPQVDVTQPRWNTWRLPGPGLVSDHFFTLSFTGTEHSVNVRLAAWPIEPHPGRGPEPVGTMDLSLTRRS